MSLCNILNAKEVNNTKMKKYLPIMVAVLVVGLGAGAYMLTKNKDTTKKEGITTTSDLSDKEEAREEVGEFAGSLADAVNLGTAMKCSWKNDEKNMSEAYIKKDKIYYEVTVEGEKSFVISKDNCVWSWSENEGIKICYEEEEFEENKIPSSGGAQAGGFEFKCAPTVINDSMFNEPSDVTFTNPMDFMPEGFQPPTQ